MAEKKAKPAKKPARKKAAPKRAAKKAAPAKAPEPAPAAPPVYRVVPGDMHRVDRAKLAEHLDASGFSPVDGWPAAAPLKRHALDALWSAPADDVALRERRGAKA